MWSCARCSLMSDSDLLLDLPPPPSTDELEPTFTKPWMVAVLALAVGVAVDTLALHQPPGIGLALSLVVGLLVAASISVLMGRPTPRGAVLLFGIGLVPAAMVAVRTSPVMISLNVGLAVAIIAVLAQMHRAPGIASWTLTRYLRQPFATIDEMALGSARFVGTDLRAGFGEEQSARMRSIWIGVLVGTPLLIVFGGLFASADAVFSDRLNDLLSGVLFGHIFWRIALSLCIGAGVAGLWRSMREPAEAERFLAERQRLDKTAGITVLGLLVALFLFFVVTQVVGHSPELERISDYSENARRGFFQLVIVAFLVFNVLLYLDWATRDETGDRSPAFDRLAMVLVALTGVVMFSALGRMRLYVDAFGLTELRFYTTAFMFWLAFVLPWFLGTVLRNRRALFAMGLLSSAIAFIVALNVVNPDAFIVQNNWDRQAGGANFSDRYNSELSLDSLPTLVALREVSDEGEWCFLDRRLAIEQQRLTEYHTEHGWLGDSWAAARARTLLADVDLPSPSDFDCVDPRLTRADA